MKSSQGPVRLFERINLVWVAVLVTYLIFGNVSPGMLKSSHTMNMLQVASFLGMVSLGQILVLLVGGIDLSVGSVLPVGRRSSQTERCTARGRR
jgi:ribose transport system permease protein